MLGATAVTAALVAGVVSAPAASASADSAGATVFYPNPVQQLGDESLTDQKDADYTALAGAYRRVTLTNLDGSGTLTGRYVRVRSQTGTPARTVDGDFPVWHRDADQFEQVMGYYWVNTAQAYLQSLGFGGALRPVNQRQIELRIDQYGGDNSFFREDKANITLGKGGVDDAKVYPTDVRGEVHADGEIWSRALWDIRMALGDTKASTLIIEAQFDFTADTSFHAAALATVATAQRLYGARAEASVRAAFQARGIL
jgi:hypothetical protein